MVKSQVNTAVHGTTLQKSFRLSRLNLVAGPPSLMKTGRKPRKRCGPISHGCIRELTPRFRRSGAWAGVLVSDGHRSIANGLAHLIRKAREISVKTNPERARFGNWALPEFQRLCHMAEVRFTLGQWRVFYARLIRLVTLNRNCKDAAADLPAIWKESLPTCGAF